MNFLLFFFFFCLPVILCIEWSPKKTPEKQAELDQQGKYFKEWLSQARKDGRINW